jgi:hypothetical protein
MLNISEENNSDLYYDVDKCVDYCRSIDDTKYNEMTEYHVFWNVGLPFERKQLLPIKSFLCTQNLNKSKLNVWSNIDLSNNEYIKPYLPYINIKIWNPIEESKGTPLENKLNLLTANDSLNWAAGDLFRILVLYNYGGLYVDFDVVFLRDFAPLLDQEFMYKWSFQKDMINGAVMRMFKGSQLGLDLMNQMALQSPRPGTTAWSTELYQKVRQFNNNWTVFPCGFFNTEWQIKLTPEQKNDPKNQELIKFITYPFKKTEMSNQLYDGVFCWHWHNGWREEIEIGSKWQILEDKFNQEIKDKFQI